ncbi:MAG TPA: hypothetical protein VEO54_26635 [Thermoanaerobaculia bacterium]|nr:hypothetical protein [Thermoanaerobaculia bacterium]
MMRTMLLSLALLVPTPLLAGSSYVSALPAGKIKVDVMQAVSSPRATELTSKLQSAVQYDREQWIADTREKQPEERLAWNERLGLTKEERDELHRLGGKVAYVKSGEAEIELVHSKDGRVMLVADSSLAELNGIIIDVENDVVETPFGRTTERTTVVASDDLKEVGSFNGEQWKLEAPGKTPGTGTFVKLAVGQLIFDGRAILSYEAKQVEEGKVPRRASHVLVFSVR